MSRVYTVDLDTPRGRILSAAERLLRSEGVVGVSTRRVASAVGVTAMAMYRHFRSKDALVQALVDTGFARWEMRLAEAVDTPNPRDKIVNAIAAYRDFALAEPRYFELMFLVPRPGIPLAPESLRATPSPSFAAVIAAVHACMANGEFVPADPSQTILMVWALAHGLLALHFTGRFGFDEPLFRRRYDDAVRLMLDRLALSSR
jgi:AcrR family transcriptional regulator